MPQEGLSLERCKRSIILLSLDMTMPAYEQMGLYLPRGRKRDFVRELRHVIHGMGGASVSIPIPPSLVKSVLDRIENELGTEARDRYLDWVVYVYEESPSDHPHTHAWSTILTWCAASAVRWDLLGLPKSKSPKLRRDMAIATDWEQVESLLTLSRRDALSQWDTEILHEREFEDGPWDAGLAVESNVFAYRFRCALKRMVDELSEEETMALRDNAQAVGLENELTRITALRGPTDLREPAFD